MWRAAQVVIVPESVATIASSARSLLSSCATTCGFIGLSVARAALVHQLAPFVHAVLRLLEERAVGLGGRGAAAGPEDALRVADQADLDRIAQADAHRIEVDLHRLGLARASG